MDGDRDGRQWRTPLGLLGMIVLVALGERYVASHEVDLTNTCPANWKYSNREASRKYRPGTILCFGTSLVKHGVVSRILEYETGLPAFNLAVCDGHMPSSYYLLKRALDAGSKPSALVVDCQDLPILRETKETRPEALRVNVRRWPELLTTAESVELAVAAADVDFLAETALSKVLPSFKARFEIRSCVLAALGGKSGSSRIEVLAVRRNWKNNRGTMLMPPKVSLRDDGPPPPAADVLPAPIPTDRFRRNHLSELYTRRFLALAASRQIPVYWVLPPVSPAKQLERDLSGVTQYFTKQAFEAQAKFPNVTVIDARHSGYRSDVFWDTDHLDRRGAFAFTADLGASIATRQNGTTSSPRWVNLPAFRERSVAVPFEEFGRSVEAVMSARVGE